VVALFVFSLLSFGLPRLGGDPVLHFMPPGAVEEDYQRTRKRLGLDKPIYVQYGIFLVNATKADFGVSIFTNRPVLDSIKEKFPNSLRLVAVGALLAFSFAIPLGVAAAVKSGTSIDTFARVVAGLGQSLPSFWVGLMMINVFTVQLGILPAFGMGDWRHYVMPASCIAFFLLAGPIRLLRSSMLEVLDSEYIRLARIKGVSERVIIWKHALRNSLLPVLSFTGMYLALLVTTCILTETVFAWPGVGRLSYRAILSNDFPVIQGVLLLTAVLVIVANFLTDIIYGYVDPRIRLKA
jgi:peptide/nickel transport system permease protein